MIVCIFIITDKKAAHPMEKLVNADVTLSFMADNSLSMQS